MSSGRVGKAIVLACFFTADYGWHRKLGGFLHAWLRLAQESMG